LTLKWLRHSRPPKHDFVRLWSGFAIGGVSPIGWLHDGEVFQPQTLVDNSLSDYDVVWAACGHTHVVCSLDFESLLKITLEGGCFTQTDLNCVCPPRYLEFVLAFQLRLLSWLDNDFRCELPGLTFFKLMGIGSGRTSQFVMQMYIVVRTFSLGNQRSAISVFKQ
jgi:hypothetical protein